jgi:transcriptional adapter 3
VPLIANMPPIPSATKGKHKGRDARRSRSRNTTPSSVLSATTPSIPSHTAFLELETSKLIVQPTPHYGEILEQLEGKPSSLEPKRLQDIIEQLKKLSEAADIRVETCERAMRLIHEKMRDAEYESKERERQAEPTRKSKPKKDESSKNLKAKKRKERPGSSEGVEIKKEGELRRPWLSFAAYTN